MPMSNNVIIPGPTNFMLALNSTDEIFSINFGDRILDVWVDIKRDPIIYDFIDIWKSYFKTERFSEISLHMEYCYEYICEYLSTSDSCTKALSMASELFAANTPGILASGPNDINPGGSWTIGGGGLTAKGLGSSDIFKGCAGPSNAPARKRLIGFNFSNRSPLLNYANSSARIQSTPKNITVNDYSYVDAIDVAWTSIFPEVHNTQYSVRTCTSIYRMGIALNLIDTTHGNQESRGSNRLQNYINAVSNALMLSSCHTILSGNIPLNSYTGVETHLNFNQIEEMKNLKEQATLYYSNLNQLKHMVNTEAHWDWSAIIDYYGVSYDDDDFETCLPIPFPYLAQWWRKLGNVIWPDRLTIYPCNLPYKCASTNEGAIQMSSLSPLQRCCAPSTPDIFSYCPTVWSSRKSGKFETLKLWYEDLQTISLCEHKVGDIRFTSMAFSLPTHCYPLNQKREQDAYILNYKNFIYYSNPLVSDIMIPLMPNMKHLLEKTKEHILFPPIPGGIGFLAGEQKQ
ncbi:unnamed protein product [Gordionus sp. m RMFG-2023]